MSSHVSEPGGAGTPATNITQLSPEPFVQEFLRLVDEGWKPDLHEFVDRVRFVAEMVDIWRLGLAELGHLHHALANGRHLSRRVGCDDRREDIATECWPNLK